MAVSYVPGPPPNDPKDLPLYLQQELGRMKQGLEIAQASIRLKKTSVAPTRFSEGDVFEADGVGWDPGAGAGTYIRRSGAWVKWG